MNFLYSEFPVNKPARTSSAPLIIAAAAFIIFNASLLSCTKSEVPIAGDGPLPVRMVPAVTREMAEEVNGFGSLSFLKKIELSSSVDGVLKVLYFREGDSINRGELVGEIINPQITLAARRAEDAYSQAVSALDLVTARLRDSEYSAEARLLQNEKSQDELLQAKKVFEEDRRKSVNREALYDAGGLSDEAIREERFRLSQAETQLALMEKELEIRRVGLREEDLAASGYPVPLDEKELRKALINLACSAVRAEAQAARANLEAAAREMESCRLMEEELLIKSPGTGIIGARYVEEGERLKRDDRIMTILDTFSLYAIFPVSEKEAPKIKKGMPALVFSGGSESHKGEVDLISPQADNQLFTFMVRVIISVGGEHYLKPGMFARVSIPLENPRMVTVIPDAALAVKKDTSGKVFTVRNNILSERNVVIDSLLGDEREILSGLVPGEVVALGNTAIFREGVHVSTYEGI